MCLNNGNRSRRHRSSSRRVRIRSIWRKFSASELDERNRIDRRENGKSSFEVRRTDRRRISFPRVARALGHAELELDLLLELRSTRRFRSFDQKTKFIWKTPNNRSDSFGEIHR